MSLAACMQFKANGSVEFSFWPALGDQCDRAWFGTPHRFLSCFEPVVPNP